MQVIDRLWMDHIDALDVIRASIHFRSIGQRDPLVEFKNEAFRMFEDLKLTIQHHIVDELLKLLHGDITIRVQQPEPQRKAPRKLRTNADDLAKVAGQSKTDGDDERVRKPQLRRNGSSPSRSNGHSSSVAQMSHAAAPTRIGRNDPCPCGSGKKYKRCHGA